MLAIMKFEGQGLNPEKKNFRGEEVRSNECGEACWWCGQRQSFVTAISHSTSVMTRLEAQMISSTGVTVAGVVTNSRERFQKEQHCRT